MFIFTPKVLSEREAVSIKDAIFSRIASGEVSAEDVILEMRKVFAEHNYSSTFIQPLAETYWMWFCGLVWEYTHFVPKEYIGEVFARTYGTALTLYPDIQVRYLFALRDHLVDGKNVPLIRAQHNSMRTILQSDRSPVVYHSEKPFSSADISDILSRWDTTSSLEKAEHLVNIRKGLFSKVDQELLSNEFISATVASYISLTQFFLLEKDVDIVTTVEKFSNDVFFHFLPEEPDNEEVYHAQRVVKWLELFNTSPDDELPINNILLLFVHVGGVQYLSQLKTDVLLSFIEVLARVFGNEKIRDIYYFNEQTNQFEWDESLLKELKLIPPDFDMSTIAK